MESNSEEKLSEIIEKFKSTFATRNITSSFGNNANTLKFKYPKLNTIFCSLQTYYGEFIHFKWTRISLKSLGISDTFESFFNDEIIPLLLKPSNLPTSTKTEIRACIFPEDIDVIDKIIDKLNTFLDDNNL